MPNLKRICGNCEVYCSFPQEPDKGNCFLYECVAEIVKNRGSKIVKAIDDCRYNLLTTDKLELNIEQIVEILNRTPDDFRTKVKPNSINIDYLKDKLDDRRL